MKSSRTILSCAALCSVSAAIFSISGCGDAQGPDEAANVSAPLPPPPVTVAKDATPSFADEPTFSEQASDDKTPMETAAIIPPGPQSPSGFDPFLLPEPAPVDDSWRKQWGTEFEAAKVKAQAEGKDILVNFTGSEWCTYCIQLAREVFREPQFAEYSRKNFILVEADFPQNQFGEPEAKSPEFQELSERFEIEGFPTILLFDKQGRPYAQTGYQPGGVEAYNEHLEQLRGARVERDAALTEADGLQGVERAKKLDEALVSLPSSLVLPAYESVVAEIIKLDSDNAAELRSQYEDVLANHQFMTRIQALEKQVPSAENPDAVLTEIDALEEAFGKDPRRNFIISMFRINVLNYFDRIDDVLKVAAAALQNESLDTDYQAQLYITQLKILNQADRQQDALSIIDQAIEKFQKDDSLRMEFFLARADFLSRLDRKEEARTAVQEARKAGGSAAAFRIDQFEQAVLGSVSTDSDLKPNLPEPAKPADSKPAKIELPETAPK